MGQPEPAETMSLGKDVDIDVIMEHDEQKLKQLGYNPVLSRAWGSVGIVCMTLSAMSVLTSIVGSLDWSLIYGGPVVIVWGWVAVGLIVLCVALSMAELSSAFPTAGGLLYYVHRLTPPGWGPLWTFTMGWMNLIAQVAGNAAQTALLGDLTITFVDMFCAWLEVEAPEFSKGASYGIYAAWTIIASGLNSLGNRTNIIITEIGGWLNIGGSAALAIIIPCVATFHNSASFVFTAYNDAEAVESGISSPVYVVLLGLLLPAWAYVGLDGAEYMAEETVNVGIAQPKAILFGWVSMFVFGFGLVLSLLFSMPDLSYAVSEDSPSGGFAMAQIMYDVFEQSTGSPLAGMLLFFIPFFAVLTCQVSSMTYTARLLFSAARDEMVPFSGWLSVHSKRFGTPIHSVIGVTIGALILGLPLLISTVVFESLISLSTIAIYVIYCFPSMLRVTVGRDLFVPGPFHLGRLAYVTGTVAALWMLFVTVVFSLPTAYPITAETLNWAPFALVATLAIATAFYLLKRCLGRPFKGCNFDMAAFEAELNAKKLQHGMP